MGKAKAGGDRAGRGRPPKGGPARVTVLNLKGSPALRDWLAGLSEETMIPMSSIARDALTKWAAERDLPPPPKG